MDPEYDLPELEDDMPPIDDELREAMEDMVRKLMTLRRLQKLLALLSTVCFWNVVGGGSLFAHAVVIIIWGSHLSRKAGNLIGRAYPWLHSIPFLYGPYGGKDYNGITAGQRIFAEAQRTGDVLTVRLMWLADRARMIGWFGIGMLGYVAAWIMVGLMREFMI